MFPRYKYIYDNLLVRVRLVMTNGKKVLIIATTPLQQDGISKVILDFYNIGGNANYIVDIASGQIPDESYNVFIRNASIRYFQLPDRNHKLFSYIFALKKLCKNNSYDVVHVHGNSALMAFDVFASWLGGVKKRIAHCHNTMTDHRVINALLKPLLNVLVTDKVACSIAAGEWIYSKPYSVVLNGIPIDDFKFDPRIRHIKRRELGFDNELVIGHVGRFSYAKNHEFLINVFTEVVKRNSNCRLLMIGNGANVDAVMSVLRQRGLSDKAIWLSSSSEVNQLMQAMDVFVLPSRFEGLPIVAIEAQASGLPCLLSNAITLESKVTNDCHFLSLNDKDSWVEYVLNYYNHNADKRYDGADCVRKAGFDFNDFCKEISELWQ